MEEQKILFADIYRLLGSIRGELKVIDKSAQELLYKQADWDQTSLLVNGIASEADIVRRMSEAIMVYINGFLDGGPYEGERAGTTPLEALAEMQREATAG